MCPLCPGTSLRKACHSPENCVRLKFLNEGRDKANLQRITITDEGVQWVNAPPVLDVQETLHTVLGENKELRKEVGDLKEEVAKLQTIVEGLAKTKPAPPQKEQDPKEGTSGKGTKGKGKPKGGQK